MAILAPPSTRISIQLRNIFARHHEVLVDTNTPVAPWALGRLVGILVDLGHVLVSGWFGRMAAAGLLALHESSRRNCTSATPAPTSGPLARRGAHWMARRRCRCNPLRLGIKKLTLYL